MRPPSIYGQAMIQGGQTTAEIAQAENIIKAALFVVRRARYVSGRVTEKYRSKLNQKSFVVFTILVCLAKIEIIADRNVNLSR